MTTHTKWSIGFCVSISIVFCSSFVFFYNRANRRSSDPAPINKVLPQASLVNLSGIKLDDQSLRKGRAMLVFVTADCVACGNEAQFLKIVIDRPKNIRFYGVVSLGEKNAALEAAKDMFPFEIFYDEGFRLAGSLGITRVPIKIFLEDGVIRKAWGGETVSEEAKTAFVEWLDGLE